MKKYLVLRVKCFRTLQTDGYPKAYYVTFYLTNSRKGLRNCTHDSFSSAIQIILDKVLMDKDFK